MPDELCRKCGEPLHAFSFCIICYQMVQQICNICGKKPEERFHSRCMYELQILKLFPVPPDIYLLKTIKVKALSPAIVS